MSFGASTESVWKASRKGRTLLTTVLSTADTSALKAPPYEPNNNWFHAVSKVKRWFASTTVNSPQILSSHEVVAGTRSEINMEVWRYVMNITDLRIPGQLICNKWVIRTYQQLSHKQSSANRPGMSSGRLWKYCDKELLPIECLPRTYLLSLLNRGYLGQSYVYF